MKNKVMVAMLGIALTSCLLTATGAHADGCTRNHELSRIVPEYRAAMLDAGEIKRVMFVDSKDERLSTWKPGHNITYCPDENRMINTTINSVATLLSELSTKCEPLLISNEIDRALEKAWEHTNQPSGDPNVMLTEAKSRLGWYYVVCTDHADAWFKKEDFKDFAYIAAGLMRVNMSIEDPANQNIYKARADKYEKWRHALYEAEGKKSLTQRIWQSFFK